MALLHLAAALAEYPDMKLALYNRSTTRKSAGKGQELLAARSESFAEEVRRLAPGRVKRMPLFGVEPGQVWCPRPVLVEAATNAKERNCILLAPNSTRFIRGERTNNRNTEPTETARAHLQEITYGVPLATLVDPTLTESERQSAAIRLSGRAGRPRKDLWKAIALLGTKRGGRYERSLREVAARCAVGKDALARFLKQPVPEEFVGEKSLTWGDLDCPIEIFRRVYPAGVAKLGYAPP